MKYNLDKEIDIQRSERRFKALLVKRGIIELKEVKHRSISQWGYLHLILTWFGMETGYTLEEAKLIYKRINKEIYTYTKNGDLFYRSSADLDSADLTKSIDVFRDYSAREANIYLPLPNEHNLLKEIEVQASQTNYV